MTVPGIIQPANELLGHDFAGGYKFPVRGRRKREAALRELRRMATWNTHDIENVGFMERVAYADQAVDSRGGFSGSPREVIHLIQMLREACARAARYQVAAEAMAHRLDKTEARRR